MVLATLAVCGKCGVVYRNHAKATCPVCHASTPQLALRLKAGELVLEAPGGEILIAERNPHG